MKKPYLYLTAGLVLLVILAGLFGKDFLSSLEGFTISRPFEAPTISYAPPDTSARYSLSDSSPSGDRHVSDSDTAFIFDIYGGTSLPSGKDFNIFLEANEGFDAGTANGDAAYLYQDENMVGLGTVSIGWWVTEEGSVPMDYAYFQVTLQQDVSLDGPGVVTLELVLNTDHLFYQNTDDSESLDITMTVDGQTVEGDTLYY